MRISRKRALAVVAAMLSLAASSDAHAALRISKKPTQNVSCVSGMCVATARSAVLNAGDLASMLAGGDVTVSSAAVAKDIDVAASLSWVSSGRLTLDSYRSITFSKVVDVAGDGALTMTTDDGGNNGDLYFAGKGRVDFRDMTSSLIINGNSYELIRNIHDLAVLGDSEPYLAFARDSQAGHRTYSSAPVDSLDATVEGLGHTISGLKISVPAENDDPIGLVGTYTVTSRDTALRDLKLVDVNVQGGEAGQEIGALVGENDATLIGVSVTGQVENTSTNAIVGGLVGRNLGRIINSSASATVTVGPSSAAGGLAGVNLGDCPPSCIAIISQSYSDGSVTGGDSAFVGNLVGRNEGGWVLDCYSEGNATGGSGATVGGLMGTNEDNGTILPRLKRSYATTVVSAGSGSTLGGLLGQDIAQTRAMDTYWDLDTSDVSDPSQGAGNVPNDPGITGLTSVQLQSGLPAGFDASVWAQSPTINGGFPYLADNPPQ